MTNQRRANGGAINRLASSLASINLNVTNVGGASRDLSAPMLRIPSELLSQIAKHLPIDDLIQLERVCGLIRSILTRDPLLWTTIAWSTETKAPLNTLLNRSADLPVSLALTVTDLTKYDLVAAAVAGHLPHLRALDITFGAPKNAQLPNQNTHPHGRLTTMVTPNMAWPRQLAGIDYVLGVVHAADVFMERLNAPAPLLVSLALRADLKYSGLPSLLSSGLFGGSAPLLRRVVLEGVLADFVARDDLCPALRGVTSLRLKTVHVFEHEFEKMGAQFPHLEVVEIEAWTCTFPAAKSWDALRVLRVAGSVNNESIDRVKSWGVKFTLDGKTM